MSRILVGVMFVGAIALAGSACKGDKDKAKNKPKPVAKTTENAGQKAPPKDLTSEERVAFFQSCWGHFNAKDKAKFSQCYTEDTVQVQMDGGEEPLEGRAAVMEKLAAPYWAAFPDGHGTPQLTLVSGNRIISVDLFQGTNTGELMGMPPSGKKVGYHMLHDFTGSGPGPMAKGDSYLDAATLMGQVGASPAPHRAAVEEVGEPIVVIAQDDDKERANLELAKKTNEAFNAHDTKALMGMYADDAVFRDMTMPADMNGSKEMLKGLQGFYKAFPDLKGEYTEMIAAGDYVAMFSVMTGTNKGAMPGMGLKKATGKSISLHGAEVIRIADGKVAEHWMFANGMAMAIQLGLTPDPAAAAGDDDDEADDDNAEE